MHVSGVFVGKPGLITGAASSPAKPGETIVLYGAGFGTGKPPLPAGKLVSQPAPPANSVTVIIGGQPAIVAFAGISALGARSA